MFAVVAALTSCWRTSQDANGLEMVPRTFLENQTDPWAGNMYPAVTAAFVRDSKGSQQLTVVFDRPHGVSNGGIDGGLDIMLHRRCLYDDGWVGATASVDARISVE
jgi:hypothetical protein